MISEEVVFKRKVKVYSKRPKHLFDLFEQTVRKYPDNEALVMNSSRLTYQEMEAQVNRIADNFFYQFNVKKGDRIALLLGNSIEFALLVFAAAKIGTILVPLNTRSGEEELLYRINHSGAKIVVTDDEFVKRIELIREKKEHEIEEVETFLLTGKVDKSYVNKGYIPFARLLEKNIQTITNLHKVHEEDPLAIMYTSGTTGLPKGAIIGHVGVVHSAINYELSMKTNEKTRTLIAVPLFHVTGLIAQLIHMVLVGGTSVLIKRYKTEEFLRTIEREEVTLLFNVPTIYVMMMSYPLIKECSLESVKTIAYGGALMAPDTINKLKDLIPNVKLHNAYGATETCSPTTISPIEYPDTKLSSVGVPVPVAEIKIVNENNVEIGMKEVGELLIKGPMVIEGYWNNEEANKKSFIDDYWASGDVAMMDEDGFIYIMDRKKDMIIRGGEKVYSVEVESVLYSHPSILEVAVVGVPDKVFGEQVFAFIVKRENAIITIEEIQNYVSQKLADYKTPKEVLFVDSLPRNPGGKVLKNELVQNFREQVKESN